MGIQVLYRADVVILGFVVTSSQLGVYSVAAPIAELTWVASEAFSLLAFSQVARGQSRQLRSTHLGHLIRVNLVLSTVGALLIAATTLLVLPVVLPAYAGAVPLVFILLPGTLVQGSARIAFSALAATAARRSSVIVGLTSVVFALLYVPFSIWWGVVGAAVAATTVYILQAALIYIMCWCGATPHHTGN
jgi:O-antigen/teichoic acid export membrane protein